jgi:hypothetical protein
VCRLFVVRERRRGGYGDDVGVGNDDEEFWVREWAWVGALVDL